MNNHEAGAERAGLFISYRSKIIDDIKEIAKPSDDSQEAEEREVTLSVILLNRESITVS